MGARDRGRPSDLSHIVFDLARLRRLGKCVFWWVGAAWLRSHACRTGQAETKARRTMTVSYFAGRTHLEAVEHAARLAIKRNAVCYVGLVRANPWTGPGEPVRYARWVARDLPSWGVWRDRVISLRSIQPSEAPALLMRVRILRLRRERRRNRRDRERNQKHA